MATAETPTRNAKDLVPTGQLVTFTLDGVEFGLDIDRVQEITPRTEITPVPGSPSFVLGVVNLRGLIIPVLDSRQRFHLAPAEPTPRTRIVILELGGQPTGFQVDAVTEVAEIDDLDVRETPPLVAGVRSDYLAGMVMAGSRLITLIDLDRILDSSEFTQRELLAESGMGQGMGAFMGEAAGDQMEEDLPHVIFSLGQESFGIGLELVEEIIEQPQVTKVPDAPDYVLGVICLRDQVLPLLDIIQLLRVEEAESQGQRDMVILLNFGRAKVGILVDGIQEIIRIKKHEILPPPQTLSESEAARLDGVVIRADRMVSLLKVMDILSGEDSQKLQAMGASMERTEQAEVVVESHDLPLVVFHLGAEAYGLRLFDVREIIMVGLITPVPRAPSFIEGVLNLRGEVMPVIDLRERFGLPRREATNLSRIIITPITGVLTGLVVDAVNEVKSVDQRTLEEPPRVTSVGANAYIEKVAKTTAGVVFLLNIQQLLTDTEGHQLVTFSGKKKG